MKKTLTLTTLSLLLTLCLYGQTEITQGSKSGRNRVKLGYKQMVVGRQFPMVFDNLETNQRLSSTFLFKPPKESLAKLKASKKWKLQVSYQVSPLNHRERDKGLERKLIIGPDNLVNNDTYFAIDEFFSFDDYNWEAPKMKLGLRSKELVIVITDIELNGKQIGKIPVGLSNLEWELNTGPADSRYTALSDHFFASGVYPNRAAFDAYYQQNPKFFYNQKRIAGTSSMPKFNLSDFSNKTDGVNSSIINFDAKSAKLATATQQVEETIDILEKNRIIRGSQTQIIDDLQTIKGFLQQLNSSKTSIAKSSGDKVIQEIKIVANIIKQAVNNGDVIAGVSLKQLKEVLQDIRSIIDLNAFQTGPTRNPYIPKHKAKTLVGMLAYTLMDFSNLKSKYDKTLLNVEVYTYSQPDVDQIKNGYKIKCIPWALRNYTEEQLKQQNFQELIYEFDNLTSPSDRLIPIGRYSFIGYNPDTGETLKLSERGMDGEDIRLRPSRGEIKSFLKWILYGEKSIKLLLEVD